MDVVVLGTAEKGPSLRFDHEAFAYAGKFVMTNTGKALARERGSVVGAAAFNHDRTDETTVWVRYITVRTGRRGDGIGPELLDRLAERMLVGSGGPGEFSRVRIAVNNPFAYEAAYKAGFEYAGERTGLAELVLERPTEQDAEAYRTGIELFCERSDLTGDERRFISSRRGADPPETN